MELQIEYFIAHNGRISGPQQQHNVFLQNCVWSANG
jgi:hypothetical protein